MSAKTHKGLKKRLKVTGRGKVLHRPSGRRHLMSKKKAKRARRLRGWRPLSKGDLRRFRRGYQCG